MTRDSNPDRQIQSLPPGQVDAPILVREEATA